MARLAKRILLRAAALALLVYLALCVYLWQTQRQHIFWPSPVLQTTPDRVGMAYEEVHIPSGSGSERGELYGWWIPAGKPKAPTLLYLHGNDKNVSHIEDISRANRLHSMGYNLLMIDYRGYGKSTGGEPSEAKVYEDAEAAWNYLSERAATQHKAGAMQNASLKRRASSQRRTFIYGHSLGGAIAIELAIHHPQASGLIVESTFTSMTDMGKRQYNLMPVDWLLNQRFDSLDKVDKLKIPVLYIHGMMDRLVPYEMSEQLFEKSPEPKFIKLIEGGGHGTSIIMGWVEYRDTLSAFVKKYAH